MKFTKKYDILYDKKWLIEAVIYCTLVSTKLFIDNVKRGFR